MFSIELDFNEMEGFFAVVIDEGDEVVFITNSHNCPEDAQREAERFVQMNEATVWYADEEVTLS